MVFDELVRATQDGGVFVSISYVLYGLSNSSDAKNSK